MIELGRDTPRQAVSQVFEKVNTGGVTPTVLELLTATYAADELDLRHDWEERRRQWSAPEFRSSARCPTPTLSQTVTLLATKARRERALRAGDDPDRAPRIGCRRDDMLVLQVEEYQRWAPEAVTGLRKAAKFLHQQYFFDTRFLPYGTQLIPLAAALAALGHDADTVSAQQKLARWYWSGVFGELHAGTTETRFARDVPELVAWIKGSAEEPRTVATEPGQHDLGLLLRRELPVLALLLNQPSRV